LGECKVKTILIIEDDNNLNRGIAFRFEKEGYAVFCAYTVADGADIFDRHAVDIIILDINLPDGSGVDFCKTIRQKSNVPIIMLTARDLEADELLGLSAGADDYITKPFSISILKARVESVLRRLDSSIASGVFKLDTNQCKLFHAGEEIPISTTEYRLLKFFMQNKNKVLPKEKILAELWENQQDFIDENTLSVNINRLRAKIEENPKQPQTIKTVYGIGYVWTEGL